MTSVTDINFLPSYRSDHSSFVLSLQINKFKKGKGLSKFNTNASIFKNKTIIEEVKKCINKVKEQYMLPVYNFEHLEDNINDDLMEFSISNQ